MLTANDIGYGKIRYETARKTSQEAFEKLLTRKSRPQSGDVLVTKDGTLGRVAVADGCAACINQSIAVLSPDSAKANSHYIALALCSPIYQKRMEFDAGGTTIKHIYISRLAKMKMALPSLEEQAEILVSVNEDLASLSAAICSVRDAIFLLREYRTRLIADVVTGKRDVRAAAALLPDEADAPLEDLAAEAGEDDTAEEDLAETEEEVA
jgi:type I restriction enzyme S subunit